MSTQLDERDVSRLDFLKASGALVLAFSLPVPLQPGSAEAAAVRRGAFAPVNPSQLDAWLAVGTDGTVTVYTGKVELGGGVATGLAQIVAEELDVPLNRVSMVMGDTARTPDQGITAGSQTIAGAGPTLRQVAADARYALLQRAAVHLGVPARALVVKDGVVRAKGNRWGRRAPLPM
jgi:nicotinate dehydrogenase subunit B